MKYDTNLSSEKISYRINHIKQKIDLEQKVKTGTENLIIALKSNPVPDIKLAAELDVKTIEATLKINFLNQSLKKLSSLIVLDETLPTIDEETITFKNLRKSGKLKVRLNGALNLTGKRPQNDFYTTIKIDGITVATSRPTKSRMDENFDLVVNKKQQVEIAIYEKSGLNPNVTGKSNLLAFVWFDLSDLESELKQKYGADYQSKNFNELQDVWLDLEPSGQISVKLNFGIWYLTKQQSHAQKQTQIKCFVVKLCKNFTQETAINLKQLKFIMSCCARFVLNS